MNDELYEKIKEVVIDGVGDLLDGLEGIDNEEIVTRVINIFETVDTALADGFQWSDVPPVFSAAVKDFMVIAEAAKGVSGETKKDFVVRAAGVLYKYIDKGLDGDKNRVNIPYVPEYIETKIEDVLYPFVVGLIVEAVMAVWKNRGTEEATPEE